MDSLGPILRSAEVDGDGIQLRRGHKPETLVSLPAPVAARLPPAAALAPQSVLDTAVAQGPDALQVLAGRFPADPRIRRAQVRSYINQHRPLEAMQILATLAALDPSTGHDPEIAQALVAALQSDEASAQAATALLEQDFGEAGVELLYDLTVKQTGAHWKPRLNQSLTKPAVLAKATPALRVAIELRTAKRCEVKRDLLPRVQSEGDRRALLQLRSLTQTQGCGFLGLQDCWLCLRKSLALQEAIAILEVRTQAPSANGGKP